MDAVAITNRELNWSGLVVRRTNPAERAYPITDMHDLKHPCRTPADGEVAIIPGTEAGTAIRIRRQPFQGLVLLEQLRHSSSAGWYVQRSFPIPESMLNTVLREMRKADCLVARPHRATTAATTTQLRLRLD